MPERTSVHAVLEDQVRPLLVNLGVARDFDSGELRCDMCGEPLKKAGIGAVQMRNGRLIFSCSKLECAEDFYE